MDAGIASEANLIFLKDEGYDYICVARNTPVDASEINEDNFLTIKMDKNNKVEAQCIAHDGEKILYCKSLLKGKKEQAMQTLFQQRFELGLQQIETSFSKKGGTKRYDKVIERIGRLKEKYSSIARYYTIEVEQHNGRAVSLHWKLDKADKSNERFSGTYFLRTSRCDLNEKEIWSLYVMLTHIEDAFHYLKSDLHLRPVWHQKEDRVDAHVFNTLLAYHLLVSIQTELRYSGITMRWSHVRDLLKSHVRITTGMTNKEGKRIYIRKCSDPEPFHKKIYNALNLHYCPIGEKRIRM
jgi:transposase